MTDRNHMRHFETRTRRWREQRWLIDAVIQAAGPDWDQPRTLSYVAPCGVEALAEFQSVTPRIRKFADIHREYALAASRREARARAYDDEGRTVAARESYFIAAQLWACARWPEFDVGERHLYCTRRLKECYARFAALAPRPVEVAEIESEAGVLTGWLHLPRSPVSGERFPCVIYWPGMDNNKEQMVAMYGDKMLERDIAVLAMDGPGQGEALARGIHVTATNHEQAALAAWRWISRHSALDADRVAVRGVSFGSFFCLQGAAALGGRCKGAVSAFVAHEPGLRTLFESASPYFKVRFMMMAGYDDEARFDEFIAAFDIRSYAERIMCPVLVQAGEEDELSPLAYTEDFVKHLRAPVTLAVYEGHKHVLRGLGSTSAGESPDHMYADWLCERLAGKAALAERLFITMNGETRRSKL